MSEPDRIERVVGQWAAVRPDIDVDTMALVARVMRTGQLMDKRIDDLSAAYGAHRSEGDVLFALRRAGPPYRLSPSKLSESLLVTSGTMTNRLDRLERRGLVTRIPNPHDRRSLDVELTDLGLRIADEAVTTHIANEQEMVAPLTKRDRDELTRITRKLIAHLEAPSDSQG
ncbi:MAG TPA: MarR family transcriptional regulator [Pseudonocardiaceae bacterium]|nr:MarR family transcriptional regulator [Pseudonocardiaceae bacterium]